MLLLALDTATDYGSLALLRDEEVLGERSLPAPGSYLVYLLPTLDLLLKEAEVTLPELDAICLSQGPGNFTGLRLGLATAQGLALALGCPLVPVPTLEVLAARHVGHPEPVGVLIDAKRGEVYWARFDCSQGLPVLLEAMERLPLEALPSRWLPPLRLAGPGLDGCRELLADLPPGVEVSWEPPEFRLAPLVGHLGRQRLTRGLTVKPQELTPLYLRPAL